MRTQPAQAALIDISVLVQFECAYDISPLYIATLKFSKIVNDYPELTLLYLIVNINAS